jgi:hypothetical protein
MSDIHTNKTIQTISVTSVGLYLHSHLHSHPLRFLYSGSELRSSQAVAFTTVAPILHSTHSFAHQLQTTLTRPPEHPVYSHDRDRPQEAWPPGRLAAWTTIPRSSRAPPQVSAVQSPWPSPLKAPRSSAPTYAKRRDQSMRPTSRPIPPYKKPFLSAPRPSSLSAILLRPPTSKPSSRRR